MGFFSDLGDVITDAVKTVVHIGVGFVKGTYFFDFGAIKESYRSFFKDVLAPILEPVFKVLGIEDETVYAVEVMTSPLIVDEKANYIEQHIMRAVLDNTDIVDAVLYSTTTGQRSNIRKFLNQGKSSYFYGVPEVTISEYYTNTVSVLDVLTTIEGEPVTLESTDLSSPTPNFWSKHFLYINSGLDLTTLLFTTEGYEWEYVGVSLNLTEDAYVVSVTRIDPDTEEVIEAELVAEIPLPNSGTYYSVIYVVNSAPTIKKSWSYEVATEVYPDLDNSVIGGDIDNLNTLPIIPLRQDFISITNDKESEEYTSTKKLMDTLGVTDLDTLIDDIESNADIDLIQEAFLIFGVNLYTEDKDSLIYLYNFFYMLSVTPTYGKDIFLALSARDKSRNTFSYTVREQRFNAILGFNYIEATEVTGVIGEVDFVETEFIILPDTEKEIADSIGGNNFGVDDEGYFNDPAAENSDTLSEGLINSIFIVRLQTSATTYTEIEVSGINIITYIHTEGSHLLVKAVVLVDPTVTANQAEMNNFIIPMSYYVLDVLSPIESEQVIYDALNLVIYAKQSQELEYYQTESFLRLVNVAIQLTALVILVLSLGTGAELSAILLAIGKQLLIQVALTYALKEILSHGLSDTEKAAVLALYVAASYGAADYNFAADLSLTFADTLVLIVNAVSNFTQVDVQNKTQDLLEEQQEFTEVAAAKEEEFKLAQEYLNTDGSIDTLALLNSRSVPVLDTWSTPSQFYDKSLLTNVADIVLSQTSTYASSALDLDNIRPILDRRSNDLDLLPELT